MKPRHWLSFPWLIPVLLCCWTPAPLFAGLSEPVRTTAANSTLWLMLSIGILTVISVLAAAALLLVNRLNKRLRKEIENREQTARDLRHSQEQTAALSRQIEQFSLTATSILSVRDEKLIGRKISEAIVEHSDFQRVLISLFKEEPPFREIIGSAGVDPEIISHISAIELPASWYDNVFSQGIRYGRLSHYIPHTMKNILNQQATVFGSIGSSEDDQGWHPEDNLFVRMNDENGNFIGVISVDDSKSGRQPNDETVRPLEIFSSLISQIIVLKREFEKRSELEEQLRHARKLEAIANLTGGIAHDFNNILGIIVGNTDLSLLDLPEDDPTRHSLLEIKTAATRARDIVRQLLSFSRKSAREMRPLQLGKVLEECLRLMRSTLPASVSTEWFLPEREIVIVGDQTGIYQIMVNLCTNAAQAMEGKGGSLQVRLEAVDADRLGPHPRELAEAPFYARITVSDTGCGISGAILDKVFDPYFTTKEIGKGTGIGLSVVHGIVRDHRGTISVVSTPGTGSRFTVLLPGSEQSVETSAAGESASLTVADATVLLVDDEPSLVQAWARLLQRVGCRVESFTEPLLAREAFKADPGRYDLLITDYSMPGMTGDLLAKECLATAPSLPVIVCTGYTETFTAEQARRMGIRHFLRKPLSMEMLVETAVRELNGAGRISS